MARRAISRAFSTRKRRAYDWEGVTTTSLGLPAANATEAVIFTGDRAETIQRVRGEVTAWLDAAGSAATDNCVVGVGLIVVPITGTAGVSSITQPGADWLWYSVVPLDAAGATVVDNASIASVARVEVDSKAMRRWGSENGLALVGELSTGDFAAVTLTGGVRILTGN